MPADEVRQLRWIALAIAVAVVAATCWVIGLAAYIIVIASAVAIAAGVLIMYLFGSNAGTLVDYDNGKCESLQAQQPPPLVLDTEDFLEIGDRTVRVPVDSYLMPYEGPKRPGFRPGGK